MKKQLNWFDRLMMAITFAEADETDSARRYVCKTAPHCPETGRAEEKEGTSRPHRLHPAKA